MWKLSLVLFSIALACVVCNAKSGVNFIYPIADEVRAEPHPPSSSTEAPTESPTTNGSPVPSISPEPPSEAYTPSTQSSVRPTDSPITQPPVTQPPISATPESVCLAKNNDVGRFPYPNDTVCESYVNCYTQNNVYRAVHWECPIRRYFNRETQTCEASKPIWCTN